MKGGRYNGKAAGRNARGNSICESPCVLLVLFIFLAFPMINLGAIGLRTYLLIASGKEAAHRAAKSLTYQTPAQLPPGTVANNVPAVQVAEETVYRYLNNFTGVGISTVKAGIVTVNNTTGVKTGPVYQPLPASNLYGNIYYLDVEIEGQANPLVTYSGGLLGPIPGITSPVKISTHAREVFENPKGLTM